MADSVAPDPFPIPGMAFAGLQSPDSQDFAIEYHIKKSLGARLGLKRSEISDDALAIPEPLVKMLQEGAIAPPDGVSEEDSPEPYSKSLDGVTEVLELFPSKKFDTIAKLTLSNITPMTRAEFIQKSNERVAVISKCFQIWALMHKEPPTTPFIFLGHGEELGVDFESRKPMPEGYTFVTFTQCGLVTYTDKIGNFLDWAKQNQDKAMNPLKYAKEIGDIFGGIEIHVYKSGDKYPPLLYMPFLSHGYKTEFTTARASGVHQLPLIVKNTMVAPLRLDTKKPIDLPTVMSIYSGSIYPSIEKLVGKTPAELSTVKVPIETVFEKFGPGVYYWPICRFIENEVESSPNVLLRRTMSNQQQQTRKAAEGLAGGKKKRRKTKRRRRAH